ncbi:hypothetical protein GCM10025867_24760 [Frondihabitans sucicola]|uniref:2'-5' RNA ligase family protein n=1 Tax=Frondihabitans sucicola TaxID=1268041 RepID=A0ABM8GP55_9MICO|nr:2'-5' RNA ligase family protein [Frondihabitans sucicola]BDZ50235.1 hypothetical protein GCM10025867_24760 [Frondihabitans sucicola]
MEADRLLVIVATPVHLPAVVERNRWPVHVTVAGNFRVDDGHDSSVATVLESVAADVGAFSVGLGPGDGFGPGRDIPVLLASHPVFHQVHQELAARLRRMPGFVAAAPSSWDGGYRPHATIGPAADVHEADVLTIRALTLVSLRGSVGQRLRAVDLV